MQRAHKRACAVRCIGQVLMRVYRDESSYMQLLECACGGEHCRARRRTTKELEWVVGDVEKWVDMVHVDIDLHLKDRVVHAMQCLNAYVTCVLRPAKIERARVRREE